MEFLAIMKYDLLKFPKIYKTCVIFVCKDGTQSSRKACGLIPGTTTQWSTLVLDLPL